jgi:hypothetical protein
VWRIFPEGFTVRYDISDDMAMTIIGTEHDMRRGLDQDSQDGP